MTVSDEAVEAAAKAEFEFEFGKTLADWADMCDDTRARYRRRSAAALTAAAPFIAAQAWDEGFEKGSDWGEWAGAPVREQPSDTNPYRRGT